MSCLGETISRAVFVRLSLAGCLMAALLTGCTRDPNVKKQKFLESGNRYRDQGKYREAAIQYLNAVQVDPRFAAAHYELSQACLKLKDFNCAFEHLRRTTDLTPDNYEAQSQLANLLVSARNPDGSLSPDNLKLAKLHLQVLREKQPASPETHLAWARYYAAQGMVEPALQEVNQAIQADPNRSESYLDLATLQSVKQPEQAEINFKNAIRLAPQSIDAYLALGSFYMSHNRLAEAEQEFKQAIGVDAKDPNPRSDYVQLLMAEGKKAEAEDFLKQTKKAIPDNPDVYRMLGDFYFTNGNLDQALAEYAKLYSDHADDMKVKKNYIQILILKNHLEEAAKLNNEILKSSPHDSEALDYRGQVLLAQNDAAGAVDVLQQAVKNDPNNAVAHYHLGHALGMQHNDAQAESELREAVGLRPDL